MSTPTTDAIAKQLAMVLACLFEPKDCVEVRRLPSTQSTWHDADELPRLAAQLRRATLDGDELYFGANPRNRHGARSGDGVSLARCLFVDIDKTTIQEARFRIREQNTPAPTMIVASGGGIHLYWRLADPITDLNVWAQYQKGLAALYDADPVVHDSPRVMRLPGFLNHNYEPPRSCEIVEAEAARVYELDEFRDAPANAPARPPAPPITDTGNAISEGNRNSALTRIAGAMRRHGADTDTIRGALLDHNTRHCRPPLAENEVGRIAASVSKYTPGAQPCEWTTFPVKHLPKPLRSLISQGAAAIGCDPSMIALPALVACAAAVGLSRRIRLKATWSEWPVLWGAVVADSGTLKSPAFDLALGPLRELQAERYHRYQTECHEYDVQRKKYEAELADWKQPENGDCRGDPPTEPTPPICTRYIVQDSTIEALAFLLYTNPRGLLVARDELSGWLAGFNQYKAKRGSDVANWLEAHRAGPITVDRKTGTSLILVPHGAISVVGTIQPDTIRRALTPEFFSCGLAARLLLIAPPKRRKHWTETEIAESTRKRYAQTIQSLIDLEPSADGAISLGLTKEAKALWIEFYNDFADRQDVATGALTAAFSKIEGDAPRIALVIQLVRNPNSDAVDADSMAAAIALADWFADEAERIYSRWSADDSDDEPDTLIRLIRSRGGRITVRELQQTSRRYRPSATEAGAGLQRLVDAGAGHWVEQSPGSQGGHPKRVFVLASVVNGNTTSADDPENDGSVDVDGAHNAPVMQAVETGVDAEVNVWER